MNQTYVFIINNDGSALQYSNTIKYPKTWNLTLKCSLQAPMHTGVSSRAASQGSEERSVL